MAGPRIGVVMWPTERWPQARQQWQLAEELGFAHAWVYDHTAWRGQTPWYDGYSTLAAVAAVTSAIGLGTLVTSPNFRHPVPTAHAVRTIDDISGGRLELGIGSGGASHTSDGDILDEDWTARQRADRFAEWVTMMDRILGSTSVSYQGDYWSARDVSIGVGGVQRPRVPFAIAATGPRGLRLVARYARTWICEADLPTAREQLDRLAAACAEAGRDPAEPRKMLMTGFTDDPWLESAAAFDDLAGRYAELGFTDILLHWPRPDTPWAADMKVFEAIAPGT
jgi:alkanesulfonate monooxygenase SsuD/methylene tetrahydromethanopterin reductase-like flavin-dependent oxidoreductase (luciferase family)